MQINSRWTRVANNYERSSVEKMRCREGGPKKKKKESSKLLLGLGFIFHPDLSPVPRLIDIFFHTRLSLNSSPVDLRPIFFSLSLSDPSLFRAPHSPSSSSHFFLLPSRRVGPRLPDFYFSIHSPVMPSVEL